MNLMSWTFNIIGITFHWVDVIMIVALLIFVIIGLSKGFFAQITGFLGPLASLILSYILAKPVSNLLSKSVPSITTSISNMYESKIGVKLTATTIDEAKDVVSQTKLPSILQNIINSLIDEKGAEILETLHDTVIEKLTNVTQIIFVFIGLFILMLIVFALIKLIFKAIKKANRVVNKVDRILGFIFGLISGVCILFIIGLIGSFIPAFEDLISGSLYEKLVEFVGTIATKMFIL